MAPRGEPRRTASERSGSDPDLTAKARIRNAALELYAAYGEAATSMRTVASAANVTAGLVVHHFKTKDGLREAVEQRVVEFFADAIEGVPDSVPPRDVAAARDVAVADMLALHPEVVSYLRRSLLDSTGHRGNLLEMLTALTASQVESLRSSGVASTAHSPSSQVIGVMVRQLGQVFLQPMIDSMWDQLAEDDSVDPKPTLLVRVQERDAPSAGKP